MPATASPLLNLSNPGLSKPQVKTGLDANTGASDRGFSHILGQAIKTPRTQPRTEHGHGNSVPQGKNLPSKGNADTRLKKQEANRDDARSTLPQEVKQASAPADNPATGTSDLKDSPASDSARHQNSSTAKEDEKTSGLVEDQLASELAPWLVQAKQQPETPDYQAAPKSDLDGEIAIEAMDVFTDQIQGPVPTQPLVNQAATNTLDEQETPELPSWLMQARAQPAALDGQPLEPAEDAAPEATEIRTETGLPPPDALTGANEEQNPAPKGDSSTLENQNQAVTAAATANTRATPSLEPSTKQRSVETDELKRQTSTPLSNNPDLPETAQSSLEDGEQGPLQPASEAKPEPAQTDPRVNPQAAVQTQSGTQGQPETPAPGKTHEDRVARDTASALTATKTHGRPTQGQAKASSQDGGLGAGAQQTPPQATTSGITPEEALETETITARTEASQGTTDTGDKASGQSTTAELNKDFSQLLAAGTARVQAEPRGPSQASELPAPMRSLDTPMGSKAWEQGVGERIHWMLGNGLAKAEIRLNPQHLGPLEIRISLQNDQTHVSILAQHGATKDAIEASLPRLREMFQDANLNLGTVDVGRREAQQQGGYQNLHHNQAQGQNQDQDQEKADREGQGRGRHRFAQAEEDDLTDFRRPANRLSSALIDDFA